jgi:hypothetical protein
MTTGSLDSGRAALAHRIRGCTCEGAAKIQDRVPERVKAYGAHRVRVAVLQYYFFFSTGQRALSLSMPSNSSGLDATVVVLSWATSV